MLLISFMSVIEESLLGGGDRRLTGNTADIERLLTEDAMRALERVHAGYFAFLAFHPSVDDAVSTYVREGSLPADSGACALVLFSTEETAPTAWAFAHEELSTVTIHEQADLPAQLALRHLFKGEVPALPGLAVFSSFSEETDVLYFSLAGIKDAADVRVNLQAILQTANKAWQRCSGDRDKFADAIAVAAQRRRLSFERTGRRSMLQWLVQMYQWLDRHRGDIVAVAGLALTG